MEEPLLSQALKALSAYDLLDDFRNKCDECDLEDSAETCAQCFPFADDARLKMRAVLARARAEGVAI